MILLTIFILRVDTSHYDVLQTKGPNVF